MQHLPFSENLKNIADVLQDAEGDELAMVGFYEGDEFPGWTGSLLVSGLSRGSLWRFEIEGRSVVHVHELFVNDRIRSRDVAVSPGGAIYMLTDTLLRRANDGPLEYTGKPGGQLLRIRRR